MVQATEKQPVVAATIAEDVTEWARGLEAMHARIAPHFARSEPRRRALEVRQGLLSPIERKNGWQLAEFAGDPTPDGVQRLLASYDWDADLVCDDLRASVIDHPGDAAGILVVDETGFVKQGTKSVGVLRQYSGTVGRIENCQVGVFLAYASPRGHAFVDRALYLPEDWANDPTRRHEAGVPDAVQFAPKARLAQQMLVRARQAGMRAAWVTGDEVYGADRPLRAWLEDQQQPYVLAVRRNERVGMLGRNRSWPVAVSEVAAGITAWERLSAGDGAKGPRHHDWARVRLAETTPEGWGRWLLVRRSISDPTELAYDRVYHSAETTLPEIVRVAGQRWTIEESIEDAKGEVGLDQDEVRRWVGWYRHITLALLAHAFLAVTRRYAHAEEKGVA